MTEYITTLLPQEAVNKYENMSFEEMSQHMAESNRQISAMLSSTTSSTLSTSSVEMEPTFEPVQFNEEEDYNRLFTRTASSGNVEKLEELLSDETIRSLIDINAGDNDGTPPLIYAACFGKTEIAKVLIGHGAHMDVQDSCKSSLSWLRFTRIN